MNLGYPLLVIFSGATRFARNNWITRRKRIDGASRDTRKTWSIRLEHFPSQITLVPGLESQVIYNFCFCKVCLVTKEKKVTQESLDLVSLAKGAKME